MKLVADTLTCERGGRTVFSGLDFTLEAGQFLLLKGPNGSGKTSLLRLIAGFAEPAGGTLRLEGGHADLTRGQHCHLVQHQDAVKSALTVTENLDFWSGFLGGGDVAAALRAFALDNLGATPAALLSAGQRRRLALARLIAAPADLWLLDEPSVGLDHASVGRLTAAIADHRAAGGRVAVATHTALALTDPLRLSLDALAPPPLPEMVW